MSGGFFDYKDISLKDKIFGCSDDSSNVFEDKEITELVWDVFQLIHVLDWYLSCDIGKDTYFKEIASFKKKWFCNSDVRVRRIVDEAIQQCKTELYNTFGLYDGPSS